MAMPLSSRSHIRPGKISWKNPGLPEMCPAEPTTPAFLIHHRTSRYYGCLDGTFIGLKPRAKTTWIYIRIIFFFKYIYICMFLFWHVWGNNIPFQPAVWKLFGILFSSWLAFFSVNSQKIQSAAQYSMLTSAL